MNAYCVKVINLFSSTPCVKGMFLPINKPQRLQSINRISISSTVSIITEYIKKMYYG